MSKRALFKISGACAVVGAIAYAFSWLIHPADESISSILQPIWVLAHVMAGTGIALLLFGLIGIYLKQHEKAGKIGFAGFVMSFTGLLCLFGIYVIASFVDPVLAQHAKQLLEPLGPLYSGLFSIFFLKMVIALTLGIILFGWATIQAKIFPKIASLLIIIGIVPFTLFLTGQEYPFIIFQTGGSIFSLGMGWFGYVLWTEKNN